MRKPVGRVAAALGIAVALAFGTGYLWGERDRSGSLEPVALAAAAGRQVLGAPGYRFAVMLDGVATAGNFPSTRMQGAFQRAPETLHLTGEAASGTHLVALEYYLDKEGLYIRRPSDQAWLLYRSPDPARVRSLQPDRLAEVLLTGVQSAQREGQEVLVGGRAVRLRLTLDPAAARALLGAAAPGRAEYRLWVYTRSLRPARLSVEGMGPAARFSYVITWDFSRPPSVSVPAEVRHTALEEGD